LNCALCLDKDCLNGKDCHKNSDEIKKLYQEGDISIIETSAHIEAEYYMKKTRIEETILFARKMNYQKIGLAFCVGLEQEARVIYNRFREYFKVYPVCCKICGIDKADFDLEKINKSSEEAMCNPLGQASFLNDKKTNLNIIIGLCIGHDILFTQYSDAPVTTLVVKDRLLAHNPLGAVYSRYYQMMKF